MSQEHVLSLSYGKDSLACIEACRLLGYPIDKIVHAEVWATETIPADLPPMVEFKKKADRIIKDRYGIEVEHVCARHTPGHKYGKFTEEKKTKYTHTKMHSIRQFPQVNMESISEDSLHKSVAGANTLSLKTTYESQFYRQIQKGMNQGRIYGFPIQGFNWCQVLKTKAINFIQAHRYSI